MEVCMTTTTNLIPRSMQEVKDLASHSYNYVKNSTYRNECSHVDITEEVKKAAPKERLKNFSISDEHSFTKGLNNKLTFENKYLSIAAKVAALVTLIPYLVSLLLDVTYVPTKKWISLNPEIKKANDELEKAPAKTTTKSVYNAEKATSSRNRAAFGCIAMPVAAVATLFAARVGGRAFLGVK
jgi:hypothetical protein